MAEALRMQMTLEEWAARVANGGDAGKGGVGKKPGRDELLSDARAMAARKTDQELEALYRAASDELQKRGLDALAGLWDYQRQTHGRGWIQREPKIRARADGGLKVYAYWAYHWVEDGRRKSEHIGKDHKLRHWLSRNSD